MMAIKFIDIPENERWLLHPETARDLASALAWAQANPTNDSNTETLLAKFNDEARK